MKRFLYHCTIISESSSPTYNLHNTLSTLTCGINSSGMSFATGLANLGRTCHWNFCAWESQTQTANTLHVAATLSKGKHWDEITATKIQGFLACKLCDTIASLSMPNLPRLSCKRTRRIPWGMILSWAMRAIHFAARGNLSVTVSVIQPFCHVFWHKPGKQSNNHIHWPLEPGKCWCKLGSVSWGMANKSNLKQPLQHEKLPSI